MKAYRVNLMDETRFEGTKDDAHAVVKDRAKTLWPEITIDEVEVQTDKNGMLCALNGVAIISEPLRTWGVTARGGLKEEK